MLCFWLVFFPWLGLFLLNPFCNPFFFCGFIFGRGMSIGAFSWDTSPQEAGDSQSPTIKDNSLTLATCDEVGWAIWWSGIQIFFFGGRRAESVLSTDGKGCRKIVCRLPRWPSWYVGWRNVYPKRKGIDLKEGMRGTCKANAGCFDMIFDDCDIWMTPGWGEEGKKKEQSKVSRGGFIIPSCATKPI